MSGQPEGVGRPGAVGQQWVDRLARRLRPLDPGWPTGGPGQRASAVLALLSESADPDLVLTVRAAGLAHHGGQISLPGGGREPGDARPADTALRETREEIGLSPDQVRPLGQMGLRQIPVSGNQVIPVVGLWSGQAAVAPYDLGEVAQVVRWPIADLADPAHRVTARHPRGGAGPAWRFADLFLWGFTAWVVDALLELGGWWQPWDATRVADVPARFRSDVAAGRAGRVRGRGR
jgi:8-oxo-dGTP pyrophosphatase MutT (NUDIX family)